MSKKINQAIPAKSLGYLLMWGGIILVIVIGLISFHRYNTNRAQDVKKIQNQIDEQKGLGPIYQAMLIQAEKKTVYALPNPRKTKLSRQETDRFQDTVHQVASKTGVMMVSIIPDAKAMTGTQQTLSFDATIKGELANFRKFIIGLAAIPYVDQLEDVSIKQLSDAMEFKLKLSVLLSN